MTKHATLIAYDEGENAAVWNLREMDGMYLCRSWEVSHEEAQYIGNTCDASMLEHRPVRTGQFVSRDDARAFFAGPIDPALANRADDLLLQLDAYQAA